MSGRILLVLLLFAVLAGSGQLESARSSTSNRSNSSSSLDTPNSPIFSHIVIIMLENRPINGTYGVINQPGGPYPVYAPYITSLANNYSLAEDYYNLSNNGCGSITDYIGITSGDVSAINSACRAGGNCNDTDPFNSLCWQAGQNIPDRIEAAGLTWRAYMENMTRPCDLKTSSDLMYQGGHNPFLYYTDIRNSTTNPTRCQDHVVPAWASGNTDGALLNDLNSPSPSNYIWLTPNICNGMYVYCPNGQDGAKSCSRTDANIQSTCVGEGDLFLKRLVPEVMNTQAWKSNSTVLFITWDEPTFDWSEACPAYNPNPPPPSDHCQIPGIWVGPQVKQHYVSRTVYQHYSLLKTLETVWGLPSLTSNDASALAMTEFFKPPPPDFSISANPTSLTIPVGTISNSTIILSSLNGFAGAITLTAASSPTGLVFSLNPSSVNLTSGGTLASILTATTTAVGNYTVTVTGRSGQLSHSVTWVFRVVDFRIVATPTSLVAQVGANSTSTLILTSLNGHSGNISLTATVQDVSIIGGTGGLGGGRHFTMVPMSILPVVSFSPTSLLLASGGSGQSTLTIAISPSVQAGNYMIIVAATDGTISHSIVLILSVTDFAFSSPTGSLTIPSGANSTEVINLQSINGFQGNVTLSTTISPNGPIATLSPSSLYLSSNSESLLTVRIPYSIPPGNYILTIQATSGTLSHVVYITITVPSGLTANLAKVVSLDGMSSTGVVGLLSLVTLIAIRSTRTGKNLKPTSRTGKVFRGRSFRDHRPIVLQSRTIIQGLSWVSVADVD